MPELEKFITRFIRVRKISLSDFTARLGYKSKTSIVRIIQGNANSQSILKFERALTDAYEMTDAEKDDLNAAIQVALLGYDGYLARNEMWAFLKGIAIDSGAEVEIECIQDGAKYLLAERYASASDVSITLINSQFIPIYRKLSTLLRKKNASVEHYITLDGKTANTVKTIRTIMPIIYEKRYVCFVKTDMLNNDKAARGLTQADMLVCSYTDAGGERREDVIVFDDHAHGHMTSRVSGERTFTDLLGIEKSQYHSLKRTYFDYDVLENYIRYSADYAALERNRSILKIKPDIGIDYISADILEVAVLEGMTQADESLSGTLAALKDIYEKRNADAFTKRQPTHTILKKAAMERFAATGRTSDHFWGMRPFTPDERIAILTKLLKQQTENPFFYLYFLRDDDALRDAEIAYYDGVGMLILDANTDYNLANGHSEAMITDKEFLRLYKDFFQTTLIKREVLPHQETLAILRRLISFCERV